VTRGTGTLRRRVLMQLTILLAAGTAAHAAEPDRAPTAAADTNTTVITADDIARERPANVRDLLRRRAGVDDTSGTLTLRGVPGIAVELNGLPSDLGSITALKTEEIERIEILRGAASARFGANAMGGAIVVTTRAAARWEANLGTDSAGSHAVRMTGGVAPGPFSLQLNAHDETTHGFRRVPVAPFPSQITVADERYRNRGATLRAGWRGEALTTGLEWKHNNSHDGYGRPNWYADYIADSTRFTASADLAPLTLDFAAGQERRDDTGLLDVGTGTDEAGLAPDRYILNDSRITDARLGATWRKDTEVWQLALHYRDLKERFAIRDYATGTRTFQLDARTVNNAVTANVESRLAATTVTASARCDRYTYPDIAVYDATGSASVAADGVTKRSCNPKLDLRYAVNGAVNVNASWGTGFIPPTADQLYYSDTGGGTQYLANPDLQPQRSVTRDAGISVRGENGAKASVAAFVTTWDDKIGVMIIDYNAPLKRQPRNIGRAEAHGVEAGTEAPLGEGWSANVNYTWTRTRIAADDTHPEWIGNELPDMPRHKLNAALAWDKAELVARFAVRAVSAAYSDQENTVRGDAGYEWRKGKYAVADASLTFRRPAWDLTLALDNIFDRHYTTGFFRLGQERLARGEFRWRF
jgi:outer membrane receptor protein involved in Fe transport